MMLFSVKFSPVKKEVWDDAFVVMQQQVFVAKVRGEIFALSRSRRKTSE
jgi:hypothetical protein